MRGDVADQRQALALSEFVVFAFAVIALLAAQWMLSAAIQGSNYYGWDGKMAQATIIAALKYSGLFQVTNISPIEGVGSQLLTMNVWVNPAYWPFALFDREVATDVSALVALGVFMTACYIMMRCFDVPIVPSAIAAQLCIVLFAPVLLLLFMPTNFCLTPGNAVVYAPHLIALGLLARIEPGSWHRFALLTAGIIALVFYGLYVDPLWSTISGFSLALAFGIVAISPLHLKTVLLRAGALASCVVLLVISGAAGYVHTLSQYTSRVQYPELIDRPRSASLVSALTYAPTSSTSSHMKYFYAACVLGWLLGILTLRGRARVLAIAAMASFIVWIGYSVVYLLLLNAVWVPPIPAYLEHCLCVLYIAGGVAGYWGGLRTAGWLPRAVVAAARRGAGGLPAFAPPLSPLSPVFGLGETSRSWPARLVTLAIALIFVSYIPAISINHAIHDSYLEAEIYKRPWPNEPELMKFLTENISSQVGQPLRGSIAFWDVSGITHSTLASVWARGMHTIDEYSQLVTPQAVYFLYAFFKQKEVMGSLNGFVPYPGPSWENFAKAMQLFGMRYYLLSDEQRPEWAHGIVDPPRIALPRRPPGKPSGVWYVHEYPHSNVGDYSPTEIDTAQSAAEIIDKISAPDFDFTKQAVLLTPLEKPLVAARNMQLSRLRGAFHVSGHSDGTSLVVLPLQFSNCMQAHDSRVRFVRANLMMAGIIFSGDVDTDIVFNYGLFSPGCRRADFAEFKRLDMRIVLRMPHLTGDRLFPDWDGAVAKLRAAAIAMWLLSAKMPDPPEEPAPPEGPTPSGPVITTETVLADLPKPTTPGFAFIGIQGLNAEVEAGDPVVAGQAILRLVAVPTTGRHYLAAHFTALDKNQVYRITGWVKAPAGANVEMELSDELKPRSGTPANYGGALFDAAGGRVLSTTGLLKGRGIEQGPKGWQKIWVDLAISGGELVLTFGLVSKDGKEFKGDGRLGLTFGGVEVAARH